MSGKNQHYLPRFLLSGFSSRKTSKEEYCWVYRKAGNLYESNISNIGVEGYFYGTPQDTEVDELITDAENEYSNLLQQLKSLSVSQSLNIEELPSFVAHLSVRTRHLRETFLQAGNYLLNFIVDVMSDPDQLKKLMLQKTKKHPEILRESTESVFERLDLTNILDAKIKERVIEVAEACVPSFIQNASNEIRTEIIKALALAPEALPNNAKSGHLRAMKKGISPKARVEQLSQLNWSIEVYTADSLILGDVGIWAKTDSDQTLIPLFMGGNDVNTLVFPISHSHAIVGSRDSGLQQIEASKINEISAALSVEYFVSSKKSTQRDHWAGVIGSLWTEVLDNELYQATKGFINLKSGLVDY